MSGTGRRREVDQAARAEPGQVEELVRLLQPPARDGGAVEPALQRVDEGEVIGVEQLCIRRRRARAEALELDRAARLRVAAVEADWPVPHRPLSVRHLCRAEPARLCEGVELGLVRQVVPLPRERAPVHPLDRARVGAVLPHHSQQLHGHHLPVLRQVGRRRRLTERVLDGIDDRELVGRGHAAAAVIGRRRRRRQRSRRRRRLCWLQRSGADQTRSGAERCHGHHAEEQRRRTRLSHSEQEHG